MRQPSLGFVGLGIMGTAMTLRLLERGWQIAAWNLEPERIPPIVAAGALACASPAAVVAQSDIVLLSVWDAAAVEDCVFAEHGIAAAGRTDKIIVDHSTTAPAATRDIAGRLMRQTGMRWVDAPVSGGPDAARAGKLTVMAGGGADDVAAIEPVMRDLAANFVHIGPSGSGQTAKLINQAIVAAGCVLMAEVVTLAEASGIDAARVPGWLAGGNADSALLRKFYPQMQARAFTPSRGHALGLFKDLKAVQEFAQEHGLTLPVIETAVDRFADFIDRGNARRDATAIVELYEKKR